LSRLDNILNSEPESRESSASRNSDEIPSLNVMAKVRRELIVSYKKKAQKLRKNPRRRLKWRELRDEVKGLEQRLIPEEMDEIKRG